MSHKIITCAGYGNTGSSVVTNIFQEIPDVLVVGGSEFEFMLLHEVDGIIDLYKAVTEGNRLKSDAAIKRFIQLVRKLNFCNPSGVNYSTFFNNTFLSYTIEYLKSLNIIGWEGWWHRIFDFSNNDFLINNYRRLKFNKYTKNQSYSLYEQDSWRPCFSPTSKMYYCGISKELFVSQTKKYLEKLFNECDKENKFEYIYFDQLVPANCDETYLQFFDNIKVIVIDRDPRDLYFANQVFWGSKYFPTDDVKKYVEWFKNTRSFKISNESIIYFNFEDFIFKYENSLNRVLKFVNICEKSHVNKKTVFIPEKSEKNTRLWEKYIISDRSIYDGVNYIYDELKEFCFDYLQTSPIKTVQISISKPFFEIDRIIKEKKAGCLTLLFFSSFDDIKCMKKKLIVKIVFFPFLFFSRLIINSMKYILNNIYSKKNKYYDYNI